MQPGTGHQDTAAVADLDTAETLGETIRQGPVARTGQPQAQQVPTLGRIRVIAKIGAVVQQGVVMDELHIAGLQPHGQVQARIVGSSSYKSSASV